MDMRDYLEVLRRKPENERRIIALSVSAGITALVAVGYLGVLVSSDRLALSEPSPTEADAALAETNQAFFSGLLGAASAFRDITEETSGIYTVETSAESTFQEEEVSEATVIPF